MSEDIITIAQFDSLQDAYFAKSLLEAHGVEVFLTNENSTRVMMHPHMSGGIGLQIASRNLAAAQELLTTTHSESDDPVDELAEEQPIHEPLVMCPQCGGTRSEAATGGAFAVLNLLLLGLPLLFARNRRKCDFCGTIFRGAT
jgi:hypothetical protein